MSSTGGERSILLRSLDDVAELVSSMRFAISLLTVISVASVIGTVLKQSEPASSYVNQYGPFWHEMFDKFGLFSVYSAWWFILILVVLIVSTGLCVIRNTPKLLREVRSWRENVRLDSLRNFRHQFAWDTALARRELAEQSALRLRHVGYATRIVEKNEAILVTAKKGAGNKYGFILGHTAIIVILVGGTLDSELPLRIQQRFLDKTPYAGGGVIAEIPAVHRLGVDNPSFRGNTVIAEGQISDSAILNQPSGVLVQELPFSIELKKFHIEFYSTGMPKAFASDVPVRDLTSGSSFPSTIKVNHPLIYKGIAVYQSSFDDGGSKLRLTAFPMAGTSVETFPLHGEVHGATEILVGNETYSVEWSGFRAFNVENMAQESDTRAVSKDAPLRERLAATMGGASGAAVDLEAGADLKNIGPSIQYSLRDQTGQAREFLNYMQPATLGGAQVYLAGMRSDSSKNFSFLRIPADSRHGVGKWMRLRAALADPAARAAAAARYAGRALGQGRPADGVLSVQLETSAVRTLAIFAGADGPGGFAGVTRFLATVPKVERERVADVFMTMLDGLLWELWQGTREVHGDAPAEPTEGNGRFLQLATNALSDSFLYGAPLYLQLDEFKEIKTSVLQVTRSPGKYVVYLGCLLLTAGVFAMFYIRERRVWVWVRDRESGTSALMAMSTQRKTLDFEREFDLLKTNLPQPA